MNTKLCENQQVIIRGKHYQVVGGIEFFSSVDNTTWAEYKLRDDYGTIQWLSLDESHNEYAIYTMCDSSFNGANYYSLPCNHSMARVVRSFNTDCDNGESVEFKEYQSPDGQIYAIEQWSDETEYSIGESLRMDDISVSVPPENARNFESGKSSKGGCIVGIIVLIALGVGIAIPTCANSSHKDFQECLNDTQGLEYITSLTSSSNNERANIFRVKSDPLNPTDVKTEAYKIIDCMEGDLEDIGDASTESNISSISAVSMLNDKDYVIVYQSTQGETLVHWGSRKFTYANDVQLYEASDETQEWYRMYYYNIAYQKDSSSFSDTPDGYHGFLALQQLLPIIKKQPDIQPQIGQRQPPCG